MSATDALQTTLAAEHAAVFLYGDLGAHTSQSVDPALFDLVSWLYRAHRSRRDELGALLRERGADPVAAQATYDLPGPLLTSFAVRRHAQRVERGCAEVYAALVAGSADADRTWAISALGEAAEAAVLLGGRPEAFPGAPELT